MEQTGQAPAFEKKNDQVLNEYEARKLLERIPEELPELDITKERPPLSDGLFFSTVTRYFRSQMKGKDEVERMKNCAGLLQRLEKTADQFIADFNELKQNWSRQVQRDNDREYYTNVILPKEKEGIDHAETLAQALEQVAAQGGGIKELHQVFKNFPEAASPRLFEATDFDGMKKELKRLLEGYMQVGPDIGWNEMEKELAEQLKGIHDRIGRIIYTELNK